MVEQMERLVKDGQASAASEPYHRLNLAFHDRLVECAGNRKLIELYRRLVNQLSEPRSRVTRRARCSCPGWRGRRRRMPRSSD